MFENTDSETLWLTITNIGLGVVTIICIAAVGYVVVKEFLSRAGASVRVPQLHDDHSFAFGELGITMADGGERIDERSIIAKSEGNNNESNIIRGEE